MSTIKEKAQEIASLYFPNKSQAANHKQLTEKIVELVESQGSAKPKKDAAK